jgi:hypothetical protein
MKPYRIALCFSGQARTWEGAVNNIKRFFARDNNPETGAPMQYDIFIHTWDTNSYRPSTKTHIYTDEPVPADTADKLKAAYNPVDFCMDNWQEFLDLTKSTRSFDGMFYSFMKSIHMKRKYELANDFEYDMVIKLRLDTIYNPHQSFIAHTMSPLMLYSCTPIARFPFEFHYNNFDDVFYYGDSKTMDLAANIYNIHKQKREQYLDSASLTTRDPEFYYGPGTLLYKNLIEMAIHPTCFNSFPWYVVRQNVANSGLDFVNDWEYVMKMCMDWYR